MTSARQNSEWTPPRLRRYNLCMTTPLRKVYLSNPLCLLRPRPALLALFLSALSVAAQPVAPAERLSLDAGWRFVKGDPPEAAGKLDYPAIKDWVEATGAAFTTNEQAAGEKEFVDRLRAKSGAAPATNAETAPKPRPEGDPGGEISFAQNNFDDGQWRLLNLPHDWGIEGPFKQEYPGETGKLPWWGVGWYRKHLDVPASDQGSGFTWMWTARWPTRRSGSTAISSAAGPTAMPPGGWI